MEIDRGSTSQGHITSKRMLFSISVLELSNEFFVMMKRDAETPFYVNCFLKEEEDEEESGKLKVLLVGAPGSGKSTFCDHVMRTCPRPWARICRVDLHGHQLFC
ncbi:transcription factor bHLH140 [Olea europaea subsp. europaea]|uniref:Transcription factor bHLH140 n=1 Tax=Olea europaea subsp. europaea TaxID=158383 RepID=A0A8S0TBZ9_OLEEU|nr:transcription factor bHLH140 [Olea europaea subsp. europaea]